MNATGELVRERERETTLKTSYSYSYSYVANRVRGLPRLIIIRSDAESAAIDMQRQGDVKQRHRRHDDIT
jgi:hypothetical protein